MDNSTIVKKAYYSIHTQLYMKHKKYVLLPHDLVPLLIQVELSWAKNEPHVALSQLLPPYDQSLQ